VAKKLYVGNLSYEITDSDLQNLFGPFGTVQSAQVIIATRVGIRKLIDQQNSCGPCRGAGGRADEPHYSGGWSWGDS